MNTSFETGGDIMNRNQSLQVIIELLQNASDHDFKKIEAFIKAYLEAGK